MLVRADTEIHFHEQEVVSVFAEDFSDSAVGMRVGEISTAVVFVLRNLYNLGQTEASDKLASVLWQSPKIIEELARGEFDTGFNLIPYPGSAGRKRFLVSVRLSEDNFNFKMSPKGFGFLAKGINYYVPVGMLAYVQWLVARDTADEMFRTCLANSLIEIGTMHLSGQITVSNQVQLAAAIIGQTCAEYLECE